MSAQNTAILIVLLDWFGSLLMFGTVWGWVHDRIRPRIERNLKRNRRRTKALLRLFRIRYQGDIQNVPEYKAWLKVRQARGATEETSTARSMVLLYKLKRREARRLQEGKLTKNELDKIVDDRTTANWAMVGWGVRLWAEVSSQKVEARMVNAIDILTGTLFVGVAGKVLFVAGFTMWNLSKGLSLWVAP